MYRFLIAIALICCIRAGSAGAQNGGMNAQFGSVPDSLFQMQQPGDAPYVIANKEVEISFREEEGSIIAVLRHHMRLKVFDASERQASVVTIPYYQDNNMEQISQIRGLTHLPDGKEVALRQEAVKTIDINGRYNVKEFTMPAVQDGAVLEYSYVIRRRYIEELPDFYLSDQVPTSRARISITYPQYLRYESVVENYEGSIDHDFAYTDTSSAPKIFTIPRPDPVVTEQWTATGIPAVKKEPFISSMNDYRGKIKFILSNFGLPRQQLETSWEVVVAKLRRNTNPLSRVKTYSLAESIGDSIAGAHTGAPQSAVQDSIYRYINERSNFSGSYMPYSEVSDSVVLSGQAVDQAAINQTLLAMLRGAGIEAFPLLTSTRSSGKINRAFPSYYQLNALFVQSEIEGRSFLMDASFPHSRPGLLPKEINEGQALLLSDESFGWQEIRAEESAFNIRLRVDAELQPDGTITGKLVSQQSGYPAQQILQLKADGQSDADILRKTLFDGYSGLKLDNIRIRNLEDYSQPAEVTAEFEITGYARNFTDGLEFPPMMFGSLHQNPFEADRDLPVMLDAPERLQLSYQVQLPQGMNLTGNLQNKTLRLPGAAFKESYDRQGKMLNYSFTINLSRQGYGMDVYPQLYNLYNRWVELSNSSWRIKR